MQEYTYRDYIYQASDKCGTMPFNQYNIIIDFLQFTQPKRICQFGCGQSTKIFQQYCQKYKNTFLYSIEHDKNWARKNTLLFPLIQHTNININGNLYNNTNKYDGFEEWLSTQQPFDFISIDGPLGYGFRESYDYSRVQLLSFILLDKINHNSIVLYHDSQRKNAQKTLKEFQRLLIEKNFTFWKNIIPSPFNFILSQLTYYQIY